MSHTRKAEFGQIDLAARSVPVVLSTNHPVQRQGYVEILDHSKVDLSRGDLPLIESHDSSTLNIGVVRGVHVDGDKLRGVAVFGTSTRAGEVLADVEAGIVTGVSIGYSLTDEGQPVAGDALARKFGFMPYECSVVAVPADPKAGFYRSRKSLSNSQGKNIMETNHSPKMAAEIVALGQAHAKRGGVELAMQYIREGKTLEEFRSALLDAAAPAPETDTFFLNNAHHRTLDNSIVLRSADDIRSHFANRADGHSGVGLADFMRGVAGMRTSPMAARALAIGTDSAGGYALPTAVMSGIVESLVPASSLLLAGAAILPLDDGAKSFNFAAVDTLPTAAWRSENDAVAESAPTFKNIAITPRSLAFMVKVSRELLADAANIESALRTTIAQAFAMEIDRVGLLGSGTAPEPRGLLNTSGIQTVTNGVDGAVLASYANFFSGVDKILSANGPMPGAAIMAPRSLVKLGALADTTTQPLQVPGMLQNIKLLQTSQLPINLTVGASSDCSQIFLGDFTKMFICMRESLNIQVLTEAFADYGQIGFMCHARLDIAVQYPQAFCLVTGVR